jgi:hypothetical protein
MAIPILTGALAKRPADQFVTTGRRDPAAGDNCQAGRRRSRSHPPDEPVS